MKALLLQKVFSELKKKMQKPFRVIQNYLNGKTGLTKLGDFYPSGDEYELVYEATGRLIPPAGIPPILDVW